MWGAGLDTDKSSKSTGKCLDMTTSNCSLLIPILSISINNIWKVCILWNHQVWHALSVLPAHLAFIHRYQPYSTLLLSHHPPISTALRVKTYHMENQNFKLQMPRGKFKEFLGDWTSNHIKNSQLSPALHNVMVDQLRRLKSALLGQCLTSLDIITSNWDQESAVFVSLETAADIGALHQRECANVSCLITAERKPHAPDQVTDIANLSTSETFDATVTSERSLDTVVFRTSDDTSRRRKTTVSSTTDSLDLTQHMHFVIYCNVGPSVSSNWDKNRQRVENWKKCHGMSVRDGVIWGCEGKRGDEKMLFCEERGFEGWGLCRSEGWGWRGCCGKCLGKVGGEGKRCFSVRHAGWECLTDSK